jgi:RHS repeat-associated protein
MESSSMPGPPASTVIPGDLSIWLTSTAAQTDFDNVTLTSGTAIYYYVEDMLGTSRVITTSSGVVCYDADFYPFGGERPYTNTCPQNYKFEGKERDTETGNDDFGARYYSNRFGRWLSADWSSVPVPVPYANLTNPQTLNLYAMVSDDPESFADLDGHTSFFMSMNAVPPAQCAMTACSFDEYNYGERGTAGGSMAPWAPPSQTSWRKIQAQAAQRQAQNNEQTRANVAATAEKYNGSTDWGFGVPQVHRRIKCHF